MGVVDVCWMAVQCSVECRMDDAELPTRHVCVLPDRHLVFRWQIRTSESKWKAEEQVANWQPLDGWIVHCCIYRRCRLQMTTLAPVDQWQFLLSLVLGPPTTAIMRLRELTFSRWESVSLSLFLLLLLCLLLLCLLLLLLLLSWIFAFLLFQNRQDQKRAELDEVLKEYIAEWRKQRVKEEEELKKLKEKQARRKVRDTHTRIL